MRAINEMTWEEFCDLANLITAGYFNGNCSRDKKEVEVGGYGLRRRVEWIMNFGAYDEYHYMEISAVIESNSWDFSCKCGTKLDSITKKPIFEHNVNICNIGKVVDYCRDRNLDIDNI